MSHNRWSRTTSRFLAILVLAACQSVAPIADPIVFTFATGVNSSTVVASIRNTGDDVLFLPRCGDHLRPAIERRSGDAWVNAVADVCLANLRMDPIRLDVGGVYEDSVAVMQPGTYRLRLSILRSSSAAASESIVSQSFVVE